MNSSLEILFLRRPPIDYISPPVCEALFSSSGGPVIVLNPLHGQAFPTGLVLGGVGGFELSWDNYPGALCYSIYKADTSDPFGSYTIIAECIPNPPLNIEPFGSGDYRVTAITKDGETPLSLPIHFGSEPIVGCGTVPDAYWAFEDAGNVSFLDSVAGLPWTYNSGNHAGIAQPGKIAQGFETSVNSFQVSNYQVSGSAQIRYQAAGLSVFTWWKANAVTATPASPTEHGIYIFQFDDAPGFAGGAGNLKMSWFPGDNILRLQLSNGFAANVLTLIVPFSAVVGQSYSIRSYYTVTGRLGIQINNGAKNETPGTYLGVGSGTSGGLITFNVAGFGDSMNTTLDEFAFFARVITDGEATCLYNNGLGRTWPFI